MKAGIVIGAISAVIGILVGTGMHFAKPPMDPAFEVQKLVLADYEAPVDECWKDIGGYKSFICKIDLDHPQLGNLWCFTVEKWDGAKPTEVLLSTSGYDCDYEAVKDDSLQSSY